jgi:Prealbumin-like fold domain
MEHHEFDDLSKRFANNPSRRALLKAIIGGAIGVRFGAAIHSAAAEDATPIAGCSVDDDCGEAGICCSEICQQVECCAGDAEDTRCGDGQACTAGFCEAPPQCSVDTDCDPCNACMSGVCTWLCGETCGATCDATAGEHGTCRFDCRAGDGNACCDVGLICDRQTGACGTREEVLGTLVILNVDDKGNALIGACFDLVSVQTGEVLTLQPHCDGGFADNVADGMVTFAHSVRGTLVVRESSAPAGFLPGADQVTPAIGAGETVTVTFVNTPISSPPQPTSAPEPPAASGGGTTTTTASTASTTTTLPNTGGDDVSDSHRSWWLSGTALIGGAAALLGGKRIHKSGDES